MRLNSNSVFTSCPNFISFTLFAWLCLLPYYELTFRECSPLDARQACFAWGDSQLRSVISKKSIYISLLFDFSNVLKKVNEMPHLQLSTNQSIETMNPFVSRLICRFKGMLIPKKQKSYFSFERPYSVLLFQGNALYLL